MRFSKNISELKGSGVTMTVLCPGPTHTGFGQRAGLNLSRLSSWIPVSDARTVAQVGFESMQRGETLVIPGLLNRLAAFGTRLAPRRLLAAIVRAMQERVVRQIPMLRAMRRELETGSRPLLFGHAGGNPRHGQGVTYGLPRQFPTLPGLSAKGILDVQELELPKIAIV